MQIKIFLVAILMLTLLTPFVMAATISITTEPGTMTNGASGQIAASISAGGSSYSGTVQVSCDPSSYSIPEGSYSVSLSAGGSVTKSYTFTPEATGTYTCQVTDGTYSSSPFTVSVEDPSVLTAALSPTTRTNINGTQAFTLTGTITNSQASDITTSYTLSYSSTYFNASGDLTSSSSTTISAGSTATLTWTIGLAAGFTSGSQTITFQIGSGSASNPTSVVTSTGPTTTTTTTTTSSGSGSGSGTETTTTVVGVTTTVLAGETTTTVAGETTTTIVGATTTTVAGEKEIISPKAKRNLTIVFVIVAIIAVVAFVLYKQGVISLPE